MLHPFEFTFHVTVGTLCVIALYVASALNGILCDVVYCAVCALALVFHHTIVNPSLAILTGHTLHVVALFHIVHDALVVQILVAPFLLNVHVTPLWVIA